MNHSQKKHYQSYKIGTIRNDVFAVIHKPPLTYDRSYKIGQLKPSLDYLDQHGINKYQEFIKILHNYGFKAKDDINLIESFQLFLNSKNPPIPVLFIRKRELKKSNAGERNIIMNRISHEYPHEFSEYLEGYLHYNYSEMVNQEMLVHDLRSMIKELSKQEVASDISFFDFSQPNDFDYLENINFDMYFDDLTF